MWITFRGVAVIAVLATSAWLVPPASAVEGNADGFRYCDWYNMQGFHDQGIDGSGVTFGIIDRPVNVEVPTVQGTNDGAPRSSRTSCVWR